MNRFKQFLTYAFKGKRRYVSGTIILLVIIAGVGYAWSNDNGEFERYTVTRGTVVEEVSVIGKIKAAQDVTLAFESAGTISEVLAPVGSKVVKGDVLVRIRAGELAALRDTAAAKLAELTSGTRPEEIAISESDFAEARAQENDKRQILVTALAEALTRAEDALAVSDRLLDNPNSESAVISFSISDPELRLSIYSSRKKISETLVLWRARKAAETGTDPTALYRLSVENLALWRRHLTLMTQALNELPNDVVIKTIPITTVRSDISSARLSIETAESSINTAYNGWRSAVTAQNSSESELSLTRAGTRTEQIAAQAAALREAEAKLEKAAIRAPFDGVVTRMDARVGETVGINAVVAALSSGSSFEIEAFVPEIEIAKVSLGNSASVTLDAYGPDISFSGNVFSIDLTDTTVSGVPTYKTRLALNEGDDRIRSGMTANLIIRSAPAQNLVVIPSRALTMHEGKRVVRIPTKKSGDDFSFHVVSIGKHSADGMVEVTGGLSSGDIILVPLVSTP